MRYIICQRCGQLLNSQEMFCPTCGLKVKSIKGIWRTLWSLSYASLRCCLQCLLKHPEPGCGNQRNMMELFGSQEK